MTSPGSGLLRADTDTAGTRSTGGQVHAVDEKTAYTNIYTALRRGKKFFVQTRSGEWGLVDRYGNKSKGDAD